ncbi:MAG: hypothetical protein AB1714_22370 [Acidobacteriota bacterium]
MSVEEQHRSEQGFEEAFREWGRRPARMPAHIASQRIASKLDQRRRKPRWRWLAAAAAIVFAVAGAWLLWQQALPDSRPPSMEITQPALDENVVLWWLDSNTPVYFVITTSS